ncbi:MAG: radical SAM family heme chaperone HemW [Chitinophagaceae bacterium]|jgi:oxygen-independent coproporphyrinogen-3 oxidase
MAGIYIHIPFCRKACHYCNFHFSTSLQKAPEVLKSIEKEMEIRSEELKEEINTVYFGGGTPSLIESEAIASMLNQAKKYFKIAPDAEITLEANPDDINIQKAKSWKSIGINRFSLGIQSFADENLQWMNRAHNAVQSFAAIDTIRNVGFENFSIDLIYGTPGQTKEGWIKDVETALKLNIPHLSCYALTVEEKTALHTLIQKGEKQEVNQDEQAERFNVLMELTAEAEYHHYEISNLALPGFESKHNSSYWEGISYIGFGPSAHSYDGKKRKWNIANNIKYVEAIAKQILPLEEETLSQNDKLNEYTMTSIRRSKGIEKNRLIQLGGESRLPEIQKMIQPYLESNKVVEDEKGWRLTNEGKFYADGIAAALFILD